MATLKERLEENYRSAYAIGKEKGLTAEQLTSLLKGKNPKKDEQPDSYLTRLLEYIDNYIEDLANPGVSFSDYRFTMKPASLINAPINSPPKISKELIFSIDGDTLSDKDLGEQELLMTSIESALFALRLGSKHNDYFKSALWTLTFSILKVIPTCATMIKIDDKGKVSQEHDISHIKDSFYKYNLPGDKRIIDYFYVKLAYFGIISASKQITNDNKSALQNRFDKWCSSMGITAINTPSPFIDTDTLLPFYYTMYNSTNWGNLFRNHVYNNSGLIKPEFPSLKSVYDSSMMIMKDYKQKHLTMFDKLLTNPTEVLILPSVIRELKHWSSSKEELLKKLPDENMYHYLASLNMLPKNLEQSNFPTLINAFMIMFPINNYKNSKKCDIPAKVLSDLVSKPLTTIQTLTNDDLDFYGSLGVNMDQAAKKIEISIKKVILEEMKNENELEEQKDKIEERRHRKRKGQPEEESSGKQRKQLFE